MKPRLLEGHAMVREYMGDYNLLSKLKQLSGVIPFHHAALGAQTSAVLGDNIFMSENPSHSAFSVHKPFHFESFGSFLLSF